MGYMGMGTQDLGRELAVVTAFISQHRRKLDEAIDAGNDDKIRLHRAMLEMYERESDELHRLLGLKRVA